MTTRFEICPTCGTYGYIRPELPALRRDPRVSPIGRCVGFEDGLDGFCVHAPNCPDVGRAWTGPGYRCINGFTWPGKWPAWAREGGDAVSSTPSQLAE